MKRMIAYMLIIICMTCSLASADNSINLHCDITGPSENKIITAGWFILDGKTAVISSLYPDKAILIDSYTSSFVASAEPFRFLNPVAFSKAIKSIKELFETWLDKHAEDKSIGYYSGKMFEHASSKKVSIFQLEELYGFLSAEVSSCRQKKNKNPSDQAYFLLLSLFEQMCYNMTEEQYIVQALQYDDGRYVTFNILHENKTMMTISIDCSAPNRLKASCMLKDNKYFRTIEIETEFSDNIVTMNTKHFLDEKVQYFNTENRPVYTTRIELSKAGNEKSVLTYLFEADKLNKPLIFSAEIFDDSIAAKCYIKDYKNIEINLSLCTVQNETVESISMSDRIDVTDHEQKDTVNELIWSGLIPIVKDILLYLPDEYQRLFTSLFFTR